MTEKYDFDFGAGSIGCIITASNIGGAFRILKNEVKHPHKFELINVIDRNGSDVITELQKAEFKRLVERNYIQTFYKKKKKQSNETIVIGEMEVLKDNDIFTAREGIF